MTLAIPTAETRAEALERALGDVKASRPAATRVLQLADDPNTDGARLAEAIDVDPMMTAQILRIANSAAFGMSHRVASTQHAVSVIGFDAVRSVAALVASGLRNGRHSTPAGFWQHAASTAAACSILSSRFGIPKGEAFSLGLLHDIGIAILHGVDQVPYATLRTSDLDSRSQCGLELAEYGMSHAEAAARVLEVWHFPADFVAAIACHHDLDLGVTAHDRVLLAGELVAKVATDTTGTVEPSAEHLEARGLSADALSDLVQLTSQYAGEILSTFAG